MVLHKKMLALCIELVDDDNMEDDIVTKCFEWCLLLKKRMEKNGRKLMNRMGLRFENYKVAHATEIMFGKLYSYSLYKIQKMAQKDERGTNGKFTHNT